MCPVCLLDRTKKAPRKAGCDSSSLSHTNSRIPLNWSCVWTGSSVWAALSAVVEAKKGHGFLTDRYDRSLVELAGVKCCSCTKSHATGVGGFLAATAPNPIQVPSAWQLSAPTLGSPSPGSPSVHPTAGFCCRLHRHRSCSAPELLTSVTQRCTTLQKLQTNLP